MTNQHFTPDELRSEKWRDIPRFPGYQISNLGRARSLDRVDAAGRYLTGIVLKQGLAGAGYPFVVLRRNNKSFTRTIHVLVARAFIGECPPGKEINHRNSIKTDNHLDNLEYISHAKNMKAAWSNGLFRNIVKGESHNRTPLTSSDVLEIRRLYATGNYTQRELGKKYGVSYQSIGAIVRRENWSHI